MAYLIGCSDDLLPGGDRPSAQTDKGVKEERKNMVREKEKQRQNKEGKRKRVCLRMTEEDMLSRDKLLLNIRLHAADFKRNGATSFTP